jgi:hypothetical protein
MQRKYIASFGLSVALTSLFSAALVILKETNPGVMDWMKAATGHHWVTHGLVVLGLFLVLGFVLAWARPAKSAGELTGIAVSIAVATAIASLMVAGFFLRAG